MTDKLADYLYLQHGELLAAGWKREHGGKPEIWRSPSGRLFVGLAQAWKQMQRETGATHD